MSNNKPKIFGLNTHAIVGSDKIIFYDRFAPERSNEYDFVVFTYDQPFTIETAPHCQRPDYMRENWFDDFTYTYRYKSNYSYILLRVEQMGKKKSICKYIDSATEFQFGDYLHNKIFLSNGDILFNNLGDVTSSVLFSKNSPKITFYKWINDAYPDDNIVFDDVYPDDIKYHKFLYNLIKKFNPEQLQNINLSDVTGPHSCRISMSDIFMKFINHNLYKTNIIDEFFNGTKKFLEVIPTKNNLYNKKFVDNIFKGTKKFLKIT